MELTSERLGKLRAPIKQALRRHEEESDKKTTLKLRFNLDDVSIVVEQTPQKSYSARAVLPTYVNNDFVGELYVLVFQPGDGTGDKSTYSKLEVGKDLRFRSRQERVFPRSKQATIVEGFFPLFTSTPRSQGAQAMFVTSLDELTVEADPLNSSITTPVRKDFRIGCEDGVFQQYIRNLDKVRKTAQYSPPRVYMTTGSVNGKRFGDPHAIFYRLDKQTREHKAIQVVGLLAARDPRNPLVEIASASWIVPEKYR